MERVLPSTIFALLDNPLGLFLVQKRHYIKHRRDLKIILNRHDKFVLLAPPNETELSYFVNNYKQSKVVAIPNSIPEVVKSVKEKKKILLHVGRINIHQKRSDLLLPLWEKIHPELNDWEFVIVGSGDYLDQIKKEIERNKIPSVKLVGYQKPEKFFDEAPFFMMPSAFEGFPNTIIEAQSHGCVPFAFDSYNALSWIVNDKMDAHLSPAFDLDDMSSKIVDLANNTEVLKKMQLRAIRNAERFTIERVGLIWLDLFKSLKNN